ncbi:MAG: TetR/AcrR family transcriptional regulator [Rhodovibrionaceae bacterium]
MNTPQHSSKTRLLDAALQVVRTKGYSATRIDDVCAAAGLTKGSFFHHFKTKEDLALAAARHWSEVTEPLFAQAPYHALEDPLARIFGYLDFRKAILCGALPEFTCFAGTTLQEVFDTHPEIREACAACICGHAATLEADIAAARRRHGAAGDWTPESLALHIQGVLQGAFILAKAKQGPEIAAASIDHLQRYIELLFAAPAGRKGATKRRGHSE